jgi:hypothetical protein
MAKELPLIKTNTDTFQSWITKTNDVIETVKTEVITANSSAGITGSVLSPRNATLIGAFTANSIVAANTLSIGTLSANATHLTIGSRVVANNTTGSSGQVLTSNGTGVYWSTVVSGATGVTSVASGNGLTGGPITSSGSISVNARAGLVANSTGLFVNTAFINSLIQTTPPVISGNLDMNGNDIFDVDSLSTAFVDALGTTRSGTFLIGRSFGHALLSIDENTIGLRINDATTGPTVGFNSSGSNNIRISVPAGLSVAAGGTDRFNVFSNGQVTATGPDGTVELGFRNVPQVPLIESIPLSSAVALSGRHLYKTNTNAIIITVPVETSVIGTTITIVNDGTSGNITLSPSSVSLQLAGTFNVGTRTIAPGGFATMMKVATTPTTKWIVSGPGVS